MFDLLKQKSVAEIAKEVMLINAGTKKAKEDLPLRSKRDQTNLNNFYLNAGFKLILILQNDFEIPLSKIHAYFLEKDWTSWAYHYFRIKVMKKEKMETAKELKRLRDASTTNLPSTSPIETTKPISPPVYKPKIIGNHETDKGSGINPKETLQEVTARILKERALKKIN